jgi:hypothetical protein
VGTQEIWLWNVKTTMGTLDKKVYEDLSKLLEYVLPTLNRNIPSVQGLLMFLGFFLMVYFQPSRFQEQSKLMELIFFSNGHSEQ